ncbi:MAG TPA: adenosine deaminase [Roseiflexaceae bacterium]|jgi:adenosine deaminase
MSLERFIQDMPKVELHVHLEGSIRPVTLLKLAHRNRIKLPVDTVEGLQQWYTFRDFAHFVKVYDFVSQCICSPDDIELIGREFLAHQAAQNVRYSEVTYTPFTHYRLKGLTFGQQLAALNRARAWAEAELGVTMRLVLDFARKAPLEQAATVADWAIAARDEGVVALGLGGIEAGYRAAKFRSVFERVRDAGLARVPHAGEAVGPASIWGVLWALDATRIGHGVRCLEDLALVDELRARQIPLEVCPTSNVCLGVVPSLADHPLPRLLDAGLYVTVNSDDPPMFNTTLTGEYLALVRTFGFGHDVVERLVLNAVRATLLSTAERARLEAEFTTAFADLRTKLLPA